MQLIYTPFIKSSWKLVLQIDPLICRVWLYQNLARERICLRWITPSRAVDIVRAIDRNCANTRGGRLHVGAGATGEPSAATKSRRISTNSKLKVHAQTRASGARVYIYNSGCIYHDQKTVALGRAWNSINSRPLAKNGGISPIKWWRRWNEGESTRRKSISGKKKSRANCYAIKSRAASRNSRNSRSFAFDLRLNFTDEDVFVMLLPFFPTFWLAKDALTRDWFCSRQRRRWFR